MCVTTKLFADDVTMYSSICHDNSSSNFRLALNSVNKWSHDWQLAIFMVESNILKLGKSIETDFFISNVEPIVSVDSVKSLGITLNSTLNFTPHIHEIVVKTKRSASMIFRCFNSRYVPSLMSAFKIYVRPMVEYATPVWSPYTVQSITLVEDVQRSFTRRLPGS